MVECGRVLMPGCTVGGRTLQRTFADGCSVGTKQDAHDIAGVGS
jgi:hypothetical protein